MAYLVWDELNQEREDAETFDADCPEAAAREYAVMDSDGNADGVYLDQNHNPIAAERGQPICVEDEDGDVTRWRVAIEEFEPIYRAIPAPKPEEGTS